MIYDMYGFPPELYRFQYKTSGSPEIAEEIYTSLSGAFPEKHISLDGSR
jgi:aromatic ring-opening dioxygenase catalytic subunit (LigB family)